MTTKELIHTYAKLLRKAGHWKCRANGVRDTIAARIQREGNFRNGSLATGYSVRSARVRTHVRRGYSALRITV